MNWMDGFNKVVQYIEEHLEDEISYEEIAAIFGYSVYHFQRLFLMVSGVSLAEYIRCRRLSQAADELLTTQGRVIDVAVKYGYSSPNSFQRAFKAMHGVTPGEVGKREGVLLKSFPPLSFELKIKGAAPMDYRIIQLDSFRILGRKLHTTMRQGECYKSVPAFWGELARSGGPAEILKHMDQEPFGLLGISDYNPDADESGFDYYIAASSSHPACDGLNELQIPASEWAVFPCPNGSAAEIQEFQHRIVMEWLPSSGYEFAKAPDLEVYMEDKSMETWLPVRRKG